MRVYKVTLMVLDDDDIGPDGVTEVIEEARYPNRCIAPNVMQIEEREVEWADEHPMNHSETQADAFSALFAETP